jgi:ABC-type phosphate transport system substrate-binding protein
MGEQVGATRLSNGRPVSARKAMKALPASVKQTSGSLGYVEYAYAKANHIAYVRMINHDGVAVEPTAAAFQGGIGARRTGRMRRDSTSS